MAQTLKTSFTIRRLPEDAVTYTLVLPCASLKSNGSDGITADSIQVQVNKSVGSTLTAITTFADLIAEGYSVWYTGGSTYTQLTSSTLTLNTSSISLSNGYLAFALVSGTSEYSADNIIDTKTLYIVYDGTDGDKGDDGADGEDAIVADLSNELSAVPCDSEGNVPSTYEYEESVLSVYKGTTDITDSCVVEIYAGGITASYSNRVISVSDITEDEASVLISISYGTWSADLYYRIKKIYAGADGEDGGIATVYSLVVTPSSVIVDADGNYSVDSLEVAVKKVDVDGVTLLTDADDIEAEGLTIKGYVDGAWNAVSGYDIGLYLLFLEDNQVIYGLFDSSGNIVDKESVPFITSGRDGTDGQDGADGTSTGFTITPDSIAISVTRKSYKADSSGDEDEDGTILLSTYSFSGNSFTLQVMDKDGNYLSFNDSTATNGYFTLMADTEVNCAITGSSGASFELTPDSYTNTLTIDGASYIETLYKTSGSASFIVTIYKDGETYLFRHSVSFTLEESDVFGSFETDISGLNSTYYSVSSSVDTLTANYSSLSQTAENISSTVGQLTSVYDDEGNLTDAVSNLYSLITQTANSISLSVVSSTNETLAELTDIYGDDGSTEGSVTNIQSTLTTTGIDILNRTITLTADNFIVNNNSGDQTLAIDEDGNLLSTQYEDSAETGHIAFGQDGIIVYGGTSSSYNGMIKISVINGTPTLIGVDSNGETVWSLGANSTMSGDISVKFASGVFQTASQSYAFGSGSGYCAYFKATYEVTNNTTSSITIANGGTYSLVAIVPNPWDLDTYLQLPIIADYSIAAGALAVITLECTFCSSESFDGDGLPDYSTIYGVLVSGSTYTLKAESIIYRSDVEDADTGTKTWLGADSTDDAASPTDSSYLIEDLPFR